MKRSAFCFLLIVLGSWGCTSRDRTPVDAVEDSEADRTDAVEDAETDRTDAVEDSEADRTDAVEDSEADRTDAVADGEADREVDEMSWTSLPAHPCQGNRTDALWFDDGAVGYVGCGTTAEGVGLFVTRDRGRSWELLDDAFATWRINDIRRAPDGLLWVSGNDRDGSGRAATVDTAVAPVRVKVTLSSDQFGGPIGDIAAHADGRVVAEALNGTQVLLRAAGAAEFVLLDSWTDEGVNDQILDLTVTADGFQGCGSTIAAPPMVFLPSSSGDAQGLELTPIALSSEFSGELWGIAALDDGRFVAVGVNQTDAVGTIFVSSHDPYDPEAWKAADIADLLTGHTWFRGVCSGADRIVVVGERQPLSRATGLVLLSDDGGSTWEVITPTDPPSTISRCVVLDDMSVIVAGSGGYTAVYE